MQTPPTQETTNHEEDDREQVATCEAHESHLADLVELADHWERDQVRLQAEHDPWARSFRTYADRGLVEAAEALDMMRSQWRYHGVADDIQAHPAAMRLCHCIWQLARIVSGSSSWDDTLSPTGRTQDPLHPEWAPRFWALPEALRHWIHQGFETYEAQPWQWHLVGNAAVTRPQTSEEEIAPPVERTAWPKWEGDWPVPGGDYFGNCPVCGSKGVARDVGRSIYIACDEHRLCWGIGNPCCEARHDPMIAGLPLAARGRALRRVYTRARAELAGYEVISPMAAVLPQEMIAAAMAQDGPPPAAS